MNYNSIKRRHFLQGVGAALALPFLPSISPKAHAALGDQKSFVFIGSPHGGVNAEFIYPERLPGNETVLYSGSASEGLDHRSRMESLNQFLTSRSSGLFQTAEQELSPVLGSFLNPHLSKINLIRGLDIMFYVGHQNGGYLGNFAGRAGDSDPPLAPMETIDQIIARSPSFYQDQPVMPTINTSSNTSMSYARQSGAIQGVATQDNRSILNSILGATNQTSSTTDLSHYLNRIHDDYSRLANGQFGAARRLSYDDRLRLEEHMSLVNNLTDKLANQEDIGAACSSELQPVDGNIAPHYWPPEISLTEKINRMNNMVDLIVGAIRCGASRIATLNAPIPNVDFQGDWHQSIAHRQMGENDETVLRYLVEDSRFIAQHLFTNIVAKLDIDRGDGSTYLDNSVVCWVPESGPITHDFIDNYALVAGSAGGYFQTGNYVDYRNLSNMGVAGSGRQANQRPGLPYNRWLYTLLKAMNIPDAEFSRAGMFGYGDNYVHTRADWFANFNGHRAWPNRLLTDMSQPMPRIIS